VRCTAQRRWFLTPYESPAGGWGALQATASALREQSVVLKGGRALLSMNQPDGFDCPGCAWPYPKHTSSFEFCENGAKAVAFELTSRRVTRDFFAAHSVRELEQHSDYWLEEQGRLTEPMRYDAASDHYVPIAWEDAFALIGRELRGLESPDQAEFYTSGRTSNEAAFLYQLFVRRFGTNKRIRQPGGFHLPTPPRHRVWNTPTARANFLVFEGVAEDPAVNSASVLRLATLRSHNQYNTTIYGLDDRYRGVFGGRMVVFMNEIDMKQRGIVADDLVEIESLAGDGRRRVVRGFKVEPYAIPQGSIGAYYPETNPLLPLAHHDLKSKTPVAKSIPVLVRPQ